MSWRYYIPGIRYFGYYDGILQNYLNERLHVQKVDRGFRELVHAQPFDRAQMDEYVNQRLKLHNGYFQSEDQNRKLVAHITENPQRLFFLVISPYHRSFYAHFENEDKLAAFEKELSALPNAIVLDWGRLDYPDEYFLDTLHLRREAAAKFSQKLGEKIREGPARTQRTKNNRKQRPKIEPHPPRSVEPLPPSPHKRRARYRGTHPRRFAEKYKELNPERYGAEVEKVIAGGKTPAGSHRPICVREILKVLAPRPGEIAVDATLGHGGHALEILRAILPGGRLYGLDVDPLELPRSEARLRAAGIPPESLIVRRTNFAGLPQFLAGEGVPAVDVVLADLGVSSMQLDNPERGFSFKHDGPLDLRMNPQRGQPASSLLASVAEAELARMLEENADEPRAAIIAKTIGETRLRDPITTTKALANAVARALRAAGQSAAQIDVAIRRTFQALRIAINDEFNALETFLRHLPDCLRPGGRVAILTFHSGEDRRVKKAFQAGERDGRYARVAREVTRPSPEEIRANPRASSAKLRWAIKA